MVQVHDSVEPQLPKIKSKEKMTKTIFGTSGYEFIDIGEMTFIEDSLLNLVESFRTKMTSIWNLLTILISILVLVDIILPREELS